MKDIIERVAELHRINDFKNNGGEDKYFRMALIMEEVGEICESLTKCKDNFKEEHADLMILLIGNCVAYDIDIVKLVNNKLDKLMDMDITKVGDNTRIITKSK